MEEFKKIQIYYPQSIDEQIKIAQQLDILGEKIELLEKIQIKLETLCNDLKQSLLKSIFE